ncbi:helix-turn-helix domain-containing protein [Candidatus Kaiserbacteria bacterium]|nr:helix-turn-helix domain-containing protein [Candidatus Kaiserbacteria bacterium]
MVRNEATYQEAVRLRERGFTLAEIAKYCDVSKSTVSKWLKNNAMSAVVTTQNKRRAGLENAKRLKLVHKARSGERTLRYKETKRTAEVEFTHYKADALFVAGVMLYQTHGDLDNGRPIRISSTDAVAHQIFIRFAKTYLGITPKQVRLWLLLYPQHNEEVCMRYWKKHTSLPYTQFHRNQYVQGNSQKKPLHYGVGNTIIGSTVLKLKLIHWCDLLQKSLIKK